MPFWLKADFYSDHRGDYMEVVVHGGPLPISPEPEGFPWLVVGLLSFTFLVGLAVGRVCRSSKPEGLTERDLDKVVTAWERVARRAIYFAAKRRRVGLAFGNYNGYTLRNAPESRPTKARVARRRTASRGASLLHEGPALRDGSHGSGTTNH